MGSTYFWVTVFASASRVASCFFVVSASTFEAGGGLARGAGLGIGAWTTSSGMVATVSPGPYAQARSPVVGAEGRAEAAVVVVGPGALPAAVGATLATAVSLGTAGLVPQPARMRVTLSAASAEGRSRRVKTFHLEYGSCLCATLGWRPRQGSNLRPSA